LGPPSFPTRRSSDLADEIHFTSLEEQPAAVPLDWIRLNFPKGTVAGTFLHSIFEHIDFQDSSYWNLEIRRRFKNTAPQIWQELRSEEHTSELQSREN